MMDVVGVELASDVVRAVALGVWRRGPRASLEIAWDPERPEEAVARLRDELGGANRLALAVGLAFLHPKRVHLPPAPGAARRSMLALEPDRFFPVDEPLVVSLLDAADLAFGAEASLVERWIAAFEEWAPVESVEPAPLAAARAVPHAAAEGVFAIPAAPGERGLLELAGGRVRSARRVPPGVEAPLGRPLPAAAGLPPDFVTALGAARGVDAELDTMLLPDGHAVRTRTRRLRRLALTAATCAAAVVLALWALDRWRERTLARVSGEIARTAAAADEAIALRDRLGALDLESAALADTRVDPGSDPLSVLAALSVRLPAGATLTSLRASGTDWQIDGAAADAAALVPLLDREGPFQDVRVLTASSRFREGARTYETFSIAFRAVPESD
ncbi:MAG: hypothetical protein EXR95_07495 [Gemmatimonadetes bacterium]|nr:hypothetical protein [Gemmatimonadota bacterium]